MRSASPGNEPGCIFIQNIIHLLVNLSLRPPNENLLIFLQFHSLFYLSKLRRGISRLAVGISSSAKNALASVKKN